MKQPIFLGGCGSSGTTLLRKMLNAHSGIACGPEMSVFDRPRMFEISLEYLYTFWRNQDFDEFDGGCIFPLRVQPMNSSYCGLLEENHVRFYHKPEEVEQMFDQAEDVAGFFDIFFSKYAQDRGKRRWAEKTPNNVFCAEKILDMYPDAKFVEVIRDCRDVVLSLMNRRNWANSIMAIWRWEAAIAAGMKLKGNPRVYQLKYEDLVLRSEHALRKLCYFLEEKYEAGMLDYWKVQHEEDEEGDYGTQPVFTDSVGKWKREDASPELLARIELTAREKLLALGYEA